MKRMTNQDAKEAIFSILLKFAEYCDKKGLHYYLAGGTLLGAVRHKDFVPWDDDIDVFMPRPDYMCLHELLRKEYIEPYYQLKSNIMGNSIFPFAKIVDTRTIVATKFNDLDNALWIDIFPLDGVPSNQKQCGRFLQKANRWKKIFAYSVANFGTGTTKRKAITKIPVLIAARMIGNRKCEKKLNQIASTYQFNKSEYIANIVWAVGKQERIKKAEYLDYIDMEFHGHMFHAPACWDKYLKNVYGNYMQLPPENKRYSHCIDAFWKEE